MEKKIKTVSSERNRLTMFSNDYQNQCQKSYSDQSVQLGFEKG